MTDPIEKVDKCPIEVTSAFLSGLSDAEIDPIEGPVLFPSSPMRGADSESGIDCRSVERLTDALSLSGRLGVVHNVHLVGDYTIQVWKR